MEFLFEVGDTALQCLKTTKKVVGSIGETGEMASHALRVTHAANVKAGNLARDYEIATKSEDPKLRALASTSMVDRVVKNLSNAASAVSGGLELAKRSGYIFPTWAVGALTINKAAHAVHEYATLQDANALLADLEECESVADKLRYFNNMLFPKNKEGKLEYDQNAWDALTIATSKTVVEKVRNALITFVPRLAKQGEVHPENLGAARQAVQEIEFLIREKQLARKINIFTDAAYIAKIGTAIVFPQYIAVAATISVASSMSSLAKSLYDTGWLVEKPDFKPRKLQPAGQIYEV